MRWPKLRWRKTAKPLHAIDEILPPEGVPLRLEVAGIGARLGAQLTDILLTFIAALAILLLLYSLDFIDPQTLSAIGALLFFAIRVPYYIFTELVWNGQTLGKKLLKIKTVAHDGGSLDAHALVVRNLMKEAEVLLPITLLFTVSQARPIGSLIALGWILGTLVVPLANKRRRRLGDLIAGTYVVHLPQPILLGDLAKSESQSHETDERFSFLSHQLDHYGTFELQTLEDLLRAHEPGRAATAEQNATLAAVVDKIRRKVNYAEPVDPPDNLEFLRTFYRVQRAYLEQRQLFGERRADKHHARSDAS